MGQRLRIRGKVLGSVVLLLIPVLALLLFGIYEYHQVRRESLLRSLLQTAETAGLLVDGALQSKRRLAETIAAADEVRALDPERTEQFFQRIAEGRGGLLNLALFRPDGAAVASLPRAPGPLNVSDRPYFQVVMKRSESVLSDILLSRTSQTAVAAAAAPVGRDGGPARAITVVGFRVNMLQALLADVGLRDGQELFVTDSRGRLAFHSGRENPTWDERDLSELAEIRRALRGEAIQTSRFVGVFEGDRRIAAVSASPVHGWIVGVTWRSQSAFAELNRVRTAQLTAFLVLGALATGGAFGLARYLGSRLHRLVGLTQALGKGQLSERALPEASGRDEIDELAAAFSLTAGELIRERQRRETFIASIAHDLRNLTTPLTVSAQLLNRRGEITEETRTRIATRLGEQARRIQRLVADLQDATELESGSFNLVSERLDLVTLLRNVVDEQRQLAQGHTLELTSPETLVVEGDGQRLMQVFTNLVNNALKYSPEGTGVRVALFEEDGRAHVRVTDAGIGLSAEELAPIFEAYTRAAGAAKAIRGLGLGLFISRGIVQAHGGEIRAESGGEGRGSTFSVVLPLRRPVSAA